MKVGLGKPQVSRGFLGYRTPSFPLLLRKTKAGNRPMLSRLHGVGIELGDISKRMNEWMNEWVNEYVNK